MPRTRATTRRPPSPFAERGPARLPAPPNLQAIDHVELWVGNARQAAGFFASSYGFDVVAYAGPETGVRDRASYVLRQGEMTFVVTGALSPECEVAAHVREHGDGVRCVALRVADAHAAYRAAVARGATGMSESRNCEGLVRSAIAAYGDTVHAFVDRRAYGGIFAPGYAEADLPRPDGPPCGLERFDHIVANVELGALERWVGFYERVLGFAQLVHFDDETISTEYSALMSTVVEDGSGRIVLPINEPAEGKRKSQIQEYLEAYRGPGVQHIAMRTSDIVGTVRALRSRGVRFLRIPDGYYEDAVKRLEGLDVPWDDLHALGVLVDRDHEGHLLQIFTENIADRPTVFFEIIQREGSRGFGAGNFKALFEAIEREQAKRGNL